MCRSHFLKFSVVTGSMLIVLASGVTMSQAGVIPITRKSLLSLDPVSGKLVVDPLNVVEMQVDFEFDETLVSFVTLEAVAPYMLVSFDAADVMMGFIRDIYVVFPGPPHMAPPGEVDTIALQFMPISSGSPVCYRVFASDNDFVIGFDTVTNTTFSINGPYDPVTDSGIVEKSYCSPEPASLTLLGIGAMGMVGYGWRRRKLTCKPGT
jgi:hypothetical protein